MLPDLRQRASLLHTVIGCTAVLMTTVAAPCQDELPPRIDAALDRARPALLDHLRAATTRTAGIGELALLLLAAAHDGVPDADATFVAATRRLARANANATYDLALRLMVLEAVTTFPDRFEQARSDAKALLRHRTKRGGFTYRVGGSDWDLSNTQYAALGLRSAAALGVLVDEAVWRDMAAGIAAGQTANGGFAYQRRDRGFDPEGYASMTAAGIAVMAICRAALGGGQHDLDAGIERGWRWFVDHAETIGSPSERWCFYCHYGLERAAILTDTATIGRVDWYAAGARMFVEAQLAGGGWVSEADGSGNHLDGGRGDSVPTAFAVLFLRRQFRKVPDPQTPHIVRLVNLGAASTQSDLDACRDELVRRGMVALPQLLSALRSDLEPQRRAAAAALAVIAGQDFGYDPADGPEGNRLAVRRAELWYLRHR